MPGIDKEIPETLFARGIQTTLRKSIGECYVEFCRTYPYIEKQVANNHIANYIGIQPESLSRIRKNLELTF